MEGKEEKRLTREDVLRLIEENGATAKGLDLSGHIFETGVDLSDLNLSGINLQRAWLEGANFNGSILDGAIVCDAVLRYATFNPNKSGIASLQAADFRNAALESADFRGAYLRRTDLRQADLSGAKFQREGTDIPALLESTDLRGANLLLADFEGCYLDGTKLEGVFLRGSNIVSKADLDEADWGNRIIGEEGNENEIRFAEHHYRKLKMWYSSHGYHDMAAKFYYREKEANRKQIKWDRKNWRHFLSAWVARWLFGYGERWKNILIWIAAVILGSALLYGVVGGLNPLYSLYFSVISFTALGYGRWVDITPQGWVQALGAAESFIGVLMMAALLVLFVRKWTR